jgi:hypothetical protein
MSQASRQPPLDAALDERVARLEARLARLESHLAQGVDLPAAPAGETPAPAPVVAAVAGVEVAAGEGEFEFEVGQNWFAVAGILALATGAAFMLSLPYASLPAGVPSLAGVLAAAALLLLARVGQRAFELVSSYLRGAGMALFFMAALRLYFFGTHPVLSTATLPGRALLVAVVALNLFIAWRRQSPGLVGLALVLGWVMALAVGSAWFVLGTLAVLAGLLAVAGLRSHWPRLVLGGVALSYLTYLVWAVGNPFLGGALHFTTAPAMAPAFLLLLVVVFAATSLLRADRATEGAIPGISALLNCSLGYGLYLLHTAAAFAPGLTGAHLPACVVFLGLAVLFWLREHSRVSTFFYAMTGYAALSVAILSASTVPAVFVWLSLQSVVVVTTAVWFRSRFIVVANFLIYVAINLGYLFVVQHETGISIGFGLVALVSARILSWQRDRLELKTELMRNAYLLCAFVVFPYALYHLAPGRYVALAWVGLALVYYTLNLMVRSQKYRWMGHATLLLTMLYVVVVGISRFEPVYRIVSFLALGTVLLVVSLSFTRLRRLRARAAPPPP